MKRFSAAICLLLFVFLLGGIPRPVTEAQDSVPAGWTGISDRGGLEQISALGRAFAVKTSLLREALTETDIPSTG